MIAAGAEVLSGRRARVDRDPRRWRPLLGTTTLEGVTVVSEPLPQTRPALPVSGRGRPDRRKLWLAAVVGIPASAVFLFLAIRGADLILMLSSMLHSIGVGNMTPSGVKLVCVDINPAVVTKLADRGSLESVGIVTDVGLFLRLLAGRLGLA